MTITQRALDEAAGEGLTICLDCDTVQIPIALPDEGCARCGGDAVYSARFLQRVLDYVVEGDDEGAW